MRILITGGAGFIGSNLIHHFLKQGRAQPVELVVNLDALTYCGNPDNLTGLEKDPRYVFVHGSIGDDALIEQLLIKHRIQVVMHLAAETHVDRSIDSPEPFFQTNVMGTLRMLQACRRYLSQLSAEARSKFRFHHISTDEVFGSLQPSDPPFEESTSYDPRSPYAASKASSDHLVRAYAQTYDFPILITNCSNNYGPRQFPEKLIPLTILNALEGKPLPIFGDGQQRRDWLHVDDHCRALELVVRNGVPGNTYAIGGESELPNLEMVQMICRILDQLSPCANGKPHESLITYVSDRPGHDRRYAISIEKIQSTLGWQPQEKLESGLEKTIRWYLDNRSWSEAITANKYQRIRLGAPTAAKKS
jgi:dTDP-glucose 4,6-dehydratase